MSNTRNFSAAVSDVVNAILANNNFICQLADKIANSISAKLEERLVIAEANVAELQAENNSLRSKMDNLEQYSRRNCIRVFGVPEESTENTEAKVCDAIQSNLKIDLKPDQIDRCHRIGKVSNKSRPIIVKFVSYKTRDKIIKSCKLFKGSKISVKEDLTKTRYELYKYAVVKFGVKNVWSRDGRISIKVDNKVYGINSKDDCDKISII